MVRPHTRERIRRLKQELSSGPVPGAWVISGSTFAIERLALGGARFIGIDLQHAIAGGVSAVLHDSIRAAEAWDLPTIVRAPWRAPEYAMQILDAGAAGIIFPMVNDANEAAEAASWCRFPPEGVRSWGPVRASAGDNDFRPDNADALVFMMVESPQAADAAEAIASVQGVDGIYVGPTDLTISTVGSLPAEQREESEALVERVVAAIRPTGRLLGTPVGNASDFAHRASQGFTLIPVSSDMDLLTEGLRRELAAITVS